MFVEWIQSPITYIDHGTFRAEALSLLPVVYSPTKGIYHYRSMAKTEYRTALQGSMVRRKKYFYALRALLAVRWLQQTGTVAPIEFERLLPLLADEPEVLAHIHTLLEQKRQAPELGLAPAVPALNAFIERELDGPPVEAPKKSAEADIADSLNRLFHQMLEEYQAGTVPNSSAQ